MELIEGIESRRSFRAFKSTPIPDDVMKKVLAAASRSPSYTNTQPWEVAVVSGKKRDELSEILLGIANSGEASRADMAQPKSWPPEMEKRSKEHGARRMNALGVERDDKEARNRLRLMNYEFYGAPCVLFLFMDRTLTSWSVFDMGLFAQSLVLAAYSFGLGTCLQASTVGYPEAIREYLGIPETKMLVLGISIGYPDYDDVINSYHSTRAGLDDFVRWYG